MGSSPVSFNIISLDNSTECLDGNKGECERSESQQGVTSVLCCWCCCSLPTQRSRLYSYTDAHLLRRGFESVSRLRLLIVTSISLHKVANRSQLFFAYLSMSVLRMISISPLSPLNVLAFTLDQPSPCWLRFTFSSITGSTGSNFACWIFVVLAVMLMVLWLWLACDYQKWMFSSDWLYSAVPAVVAACPATWSSMLS